MCDLSHHYCANSPWTKLSRMCPEGMSSEAVSIWASAFYAKLTIFLMWQVVQDSKGVVAALRTGPGSLGPSFHHWLLLTGTWSQGQPKLFPGSLSEPSLASAALSVVTGQLGIDLEGPCPMPLCLGHLTREGPQSGQRKH